MKINKGSESGAYLPPKNIPFYKSLLKQTYFLEKGEDIGDENIINFAINKKEDFFDGNPVVKICLEEKDCREIKGDLFFTVILKEDKTREYLTLEKKLVDFEEGFEYEIYLEEKHFNSFALNSNLHIDAIVFSKQNGGLPKIESLKDLISNLEA
mgnify:CR=1 FL=1